MAESFGNSFTVVEVLSDDGSTKELWIALAKPDQAVTLVLAAIPEGWTGEVLSDSIADKQQELFEELNLKPGEVHRLSSI